jgi:hypothetical protein
MGWTYETNLTTFVDWLAVLDFGFDIDCETI